MIQRPKPIYRWLSNEAKIEVRKELQNEYFYHFTLDKHLKNIRNRGIDPEFESEESHTTVEPRAMRFCTQAYLITGLSAAETRAKIWDPDRYEWVKTAEIALLRAKANSLFTRQFGLDHSHGEMRDEEQSILTCSGSLTAEDFVALVRKYGVISAYEVIPSAELERCITDVRRFCTDFIGEFLPLT